VSARRRALQGLLHPPLREARFWSTQLMVVAVVLIHLGVDALQDRGVWGVPSFVTIPLLLVPVVYGALSYGLVGALGPALTGILALAPIEPYFGHTTVELWGGWSNLAFVAVIAVLLGDRFEVTRGVLVERTSRDVSERAERRFRLAFDNNLSAMAVVDVGGRFEQVNQAMGDLLGYSMRELAGMTLDAVTHPGDVSVVVHESDHLSARALSQGRQIKRFVRSDSRAITAELSESVMNDELGGESFSVVSLRDITEERMLTARLADLALHDSLTGLANRSLLRDRMAQAHARAVRDGGRVALCLLDLDNFKGVNDTLGHPAGDELLIAVAGRLRAVARGVDTVGRLGGDEFVLLAGGVDDDGARAIATRIMDAFAVTFRIEGQDVVQSVSVGVASCGASPATDCEDLIRNADIALYEAKRRGRDQVVVYTPTMSSQSSENFQLGQELSLALSRQQIVMHFQPIVDLRTREVVALEALMRWQHPTRGLVPPDVFIPLAEQSDLIIQLGARALEHATCAAAAWRAKGAPWQVGVNLSARQMNDPGLISLIESALEHAGLAPEHLVVEITEGIAIADIDAAISTLDRLRQLGVAVVLDDFGTGYSSLAYLARLRPSTIKIDRSFVHAATANATDRNVLTAVVTLCRQLGMIVLAEGVETISELGLLEDLGVDLAQGYLFSAPVPVSEVASVNRRIRSSWPSENASRIVS
jgi:diguanylate cyclase (GGDEF)-like protein/PAS domain S-box-containing protein